MKGIRDLSSIVDSLGWVKSILFVQGESRMLRQVLEVIDCIEDYDTFDDLCHDVRYPVLWCVRCCSSFAMDWMRIASTDDEVVDNVDRNLKILKSISIFL